MMDGQTNRQTDRQTELRWLRRAIAVPAVMRNNHSLSSQSAAAAAKCHNNMIHQYQAINQLMATGYQY